jgi:hypothetical protein
MHSNLSRHAVGFSAVLMTCVPSVYAEENWTLRREDPALDVVVHDRATPEGYREFRGVTHVQSRLSGFVALFRDTARMPEWLYRAERVTTLEEVSATETYAHTQIRMPWPFRDRDSIVHVKLAQDPDTLELTLNASAVPDYLPEQKGFVRMPVIESLWRFTPMPDGQTRVEFSGFADPGGRLSSGLLGTFQSKLVWQSPYNSLRDLHAVIGEARYQAAAYPHILEPTGTTE